jgi:hypothetical protein
MKKSILLGTLFVMGVIFIMNAYAGVTVRYYNKDSKDYTAKAVCHGSSYSVRFGSSRTASVTIQGSSPCKVSLKNTVELKGGENIEIKDGYIKVK